MIRNIILFNTFLFYFFQISAQNSAVEKAILSSIDLHTDSHLELLKEVVNINSGTRNFEGVQKVGEIFKEKLTALGFEVKLTSGASFNRAGHLIATRKSTNKKGTKLLLIGHLDTVFELDNPFQKYTMVNDSIMNGPGVSDMKGGDVIIILAMQALKDAGVIDGMNIEIVMTGDEEDSGNPISLSKKELIEAAQNADIALGFENADGDPKTIVVSRRGSMGWKLTVTGKPGHSSQIFTENLGHGAIYESARILNEFYNQLSNEENLTFNPGFIAGGSAVNYEESKSGAFVTGKNNVIAQEAIVEGDIRAVSPQQLEKAKKIMKEIVSNNFPQTSAKIVFDENAYPPLALTEGNTKLLNMYNKVSQDLGFGEVKAVNPRKAGAADISFTSGYVEMAIDGLGLSGADDHSIKETGNLNMLSVQAKRAAILMYRLNEN